MCSDKLINVKRRIIMDPLVVWNTVAFCAVTLIITVLDTIAFTRK